MCLAWRLSHIARFGSSVYIHILLAILVDIPFWLLVGSSIPWILSNICDDFYIWNDSTVKSESEDYTYTEYLFLSSKWVRSEEVVRGWQTSEVTYIRTRCQITWQVQNEAPQTWTGILFLRNIYHTPRWNNLSIHLCIFLQQIWWIVFWLLPGFWPRRTKF